MIRIAVAMIIFLSLPAVGVSAQSEVPGDPKAPDTPPAAGRVKLNLGLPDFLRVVAVKVLDPFRRAHPDVDVSLLSGSAIGATWQLTLGRDDLALSVGPSDILQHNTLDSAGRGVILLGKVFKPGQLRTYPLARRALAVVAHPNGPVQAMDQATLRGIIGSYQNSRLPDPLARWKVHYVRGGAVDSSLLRSVMGGDRPIRFSTMPVVQMEPDLLKRVAADRTLIALTTLTPQLSASGLKVLPISPKAGRPAVEPTVENVLSDAWPYQVHLLAVVRPGAPAEADELARAFQSSEAAHILADRGWISPASRKAPPEGETVWPAPPPRDAQVEPVAGGAAVLPARLLTRLFLVGELSHLAAYEDAVAAAIVADGRLKLLDRANLSRVLAEARLDASPEARPPVIGADLLVLLQVATEKNITFLTIQAFHSATATMLGEMRLPIDPARPADFHPPLKGRVATWWPGVLRNLAAANVRPVWALRTAGRIGDQGGPGPKLAKDLADELAALDTVFFARYTGLTESQQEMLMHLMGLARPESGRGSPAADYLLEARLGDDGRLALEVRRGSDLEPVAACAFDLDAADEACSWLRAQATLALAQHRSARSVADPEIARRQAQAELARVRECRQRWLELAQLPIITVRTNAQQMEMRSLNAEMVRCYERAAQLDPSLEEAARGAVAAKVRRYRKVARRPDSLDRLLAALRAEEMFLKSFPKAADRQEMLLDAAKLCLTAASQVGEGLQPPDQRMVRAEFLAMAAAAHEEYLLGPLPPLLSGGTDPRWAYCFYIVDAYLACLVDVPDKAEAFINGWASRNDARPDRMMHSDLLRLIFLEHRRDRPAYLALLTGLQQRWPDPDHFQWRQFGVCVSDGLQKLFAGDSKQTFDTWRAGRRGPGDLPYPGYDPERITGRVRLLCRQYEPIPVGWAGTIYEGRHKGVSVWKKQGGHDELGRFLRGEADLYCYTGPLSTEDRERIRRRYRDRAPEPRLLGYLPPSEPVGNSTVRSFRPGAAATEPVYVLTSPDTEPQVAAFVTWLFSDEGLKTMAAYRLKPPPRDEGAGAR